MGEIGISRREFLYDIQFWEVRRLIRAYYKRNRMELVLLRLSAYSSFFAFRENKLNKTPQSWFPLPWEQEESEHEQLSEDECQELLDDMKRMNELLQKQNEPKHE